MKPPVVVRPVARQAAARRPRWRISLLLLLLPLCLLTSPVSLPQRAEQSLASVPTAALLLGYTPQASTWVSMPTATQAATASNAPTNPAGAASSTPTLAVADTAAPPTQSATAVVFPTVSAELPTARLFPPAPTPEQLPSIVVAPNHGWVAPPTPLALPSSATTSAQPGRFIPILMYHYVRNVDPTSDPLGYGLSVTPEQFAAQLDWLHRQGYSTIRMDTLARCLQGIETCPARSVALTFDDGYADAYSTALPLLQEYGFVATFYVVGDFVGQPGYMNWEELRTLRDIGMEIGAHSNTHADLSLLNDTAAYAEIAGSGERIAAELQVPIQSFCYPAGKFTSSTVALVRAAGYTSATTTLQSADQSNLWALPRLRISGELDVDGFAWLIQAYTR